MSNEYTKIGWENGVTPLNATNLNKMDQGIYDAHEALEPESLASTLLGIFYPVGSYYETSDVAFNPNTAWGGTWVLENPGLVHVSSGTGYSVNGAAGDSGKGTKDGGSADAVVVSHNHSASSAAAGWHGHALGSYVLGNSGSYWTGEQGGAMSGSTAKYAYCSTGAAVQTITATAGDGSHAHTVSVGSTGQSGTGKNMQPYVNVNRWHRTE